MVIKLPLNNDREIVDGGELIVSLDGLTVDPEVLTNGDFTAATSK